MCWVRIVLESICSRRQYAVQNWNLLSTTISWPKRQHLHDPFAAQVLLDVLRVSPARHNDEVVTVNKIRSIHVTSMSDDAPRCMFTSRIAFFSSSCHAGAACLDPYMTLTRHPHTLPSSVWSSSGTSTYVLGPTCAEKYALCTST